MVAKSAGAVELREFGKPDDVREFENGRAEVVNMAGGAIGRLVLHPGWRWSNDVKPIAGTDWCEAPHFQYHVSGTLHVLMSDGREFDVGPGAVSSLPQGHDAWVVGDDDVVLVDWYGASEYAKQA
ncbi:cupin domain-containing protein [Saccharopolyspora halophila]|uniref:Cupin domain-containing protein n=1 Tax=Saccharopolyspora halophila TaxID=405551 RepID=A0ABP5TVE7_9PSEU